MKLQMLRRSKVRCPICGGKVTIKTNHGCARCNGKPLIGMSCNKCKRKKFYRMSMEEFLKEVYCEKGVDY